MRGAIILELTWSIATPIAATSNPKPKSFKAINKLTIPTPIPVPKGNKENKPIPIPKRSDKGTRKRTNANVIDTAKIAPSVA